MSEKIKNIADAIKYKSQYDWTIEVFSEMEQVRFRSFFHKKRLDIFIPFWELERIPELLTHKLDADFRKSFLAIENPTASTGDLERKE